MVTTAEVCDRRTPLHDAVLQTQRLTLHKVVAHEGVSDAEFATSALLHDEAIVPHIGKDTLAVGLPSHNDLVAYAHTGGGHAIGQQRVTLHLLSSSLSRTKDSQLI